MSSNINNTSSNNNNNNNTNNNNYIYNRILYIHKKWFMWITFILCFLLFFNSILLSKFLKMEKIDTYNNIDDSKKFYIVYEKMNCDNTDGDTCYKSRSTIHINL